MNQGTVPWSRQEDSSLMEEKQQVNQGRFFDLKVQSGRAERQ
jgi:hypothetical protein